MNAMTQERKKQPVERTAFTFRLNPAVVALVDDEAEIDRRNRQLTVEVLLEEALEARRRARASTQ